jgi:hypothetical protein
MSEQYTPDPRILENEKPPRYDVSGGGLSIDDFFRHREASIAAFTVRIRVFLDDETGCAVDMNGGIIDIGISFLVA